MSESTIARRSSSLEDFREDVGKLIVPQVTKSEDIAFIGVYYAEGNRLENLLRVVSPWFENIVIVLQGGTNYERAIVKGFTDHLIEDKVHGFCEPSFNPAIEYAKKLGASWFFNLDGDELPDLTLLASLDHATRDDEVRAADGARFIRRNTVSLLDTTIPVYSESMARLFRTSVTRPPIPHSDFSGTRKRPHSWSQYGGIRHHRTFIEFVHDQLRYTKQGNAYSASVSADYLATMREYIVAYIGKDEFDEELEATGYFAEFNDLVRKFSHPEQTWLEGFK